MKHHPQHHHTHHKHHKKVKKRDMDNKKLIWVIIIIFALIVISVAVILILKKEIKPNPIDVQCRVACENNQRTAFCFVERKVNNALTTTCDELSKNSLYVQYNVETCPIISCVIQEEADQTCITGLGGTWEFPDEEGICPQSGEEIVRKLTSSDEPPIQGQVCCR